MCFLSSVKITKMLPITTIIIKRIQVARMLPILQNQLHKRYKSSSSRSELTASSSRADSEIDINVKPLSKKVKETTKTTSYFAIILVGLGVTGAMFYAVFRELFSSNSPNNIYSKAVKKCTDHPQISDKLGYPISAYGEETKRGRRQHVAHAFYVDGEGRKHLRMKFHLKGSAHMGTAHLDMVENESGNYEYRYLFVEIDDMFKNIVVVEDNRNKSNAHPSTDMELQF